MPGGIFVVLLQQWRGEAVLSHVPSHMAAAIPALQDVISSGHSYPLPAAWRNAPPPIDENTTAKSVGMHAASQTSHTLS